MVFQQFRQVFMVLTLSTLFLPVSWASSINYLIYGTSAEPLQIVEQEGRYSGFITDVVNEVFADSGVTVNPLLKPIGRHKVAMINGQAERWIAYALNSWRKETVWQDATFADVELLSYTLSLGYKDLAGEESPSNVEYGLSGSCALLYGACSTNEICDEETRG